VSDEEDLVVHVVDSGDGVGPGQVESVFASGFTTRDVEPDQHGLGLGLARQTARHHGGDVVLAHPGDGGQGAVFTARMVGVIISATEPSQRPADPSQRRADQSQRRADQSQRPADQSQRPADPSQRPADPSQRPADPSQRRADPSQGPADLEGARR
jgi:Histidine kinase-, DNA gyrase B-, and HSP90-like ATPase